MSWDKALELISKQLHEAPAACPACVGAEQKSQLRGGTSPAALVQGHLETVDVPKSRDLGGGDTGRDTLNTRDRDTDLRSCSDSCSALCRGNHSGDGELGGKGSWGPAVPLN